MGNSTSEGVVILERPREGGVLSWLRVPRALASSLVEVVRFSPLAGIGLSIVIFFTLAGLLAPLLITHEPNELDLLARLAPPSRTHYFGTDDLGRDIFSRTLVGARLSLSMGLTVVLVAGGFGTFVGLVAGYAGGIADQFLMRAADSFLAFPALILAMALAAAMGPGVTSAMVAIAVTIWPKYARLVRSSVLTVKENEYVLAARSIGTPPLLLILRHILPNSFAPVLVQGTLDMGIVILLVAGLSFIGFGIQPPRAEWGAMVSAGRDFLVTHWWVATIPGLAILLSVTGFTLFGDGVRDWLDPRLRNNR